MWNVPNMVSEKSAELSGAERYSPFAGFFWRHILSLPVMIIAELQDFLKNKALNDLNLLVEKGYLNTVGQGSHKVYVRADNKEVTE